MERTVSPYAEIDETIERWVRRNELSLLREWNREARFWYVSHGPECFQLSIDQPSNGLVKVLARSIETDDDAELTGEWLVEIGDLEKALAAATSNIGQWARRARIVG
jgi:hypothetical protein